MEKMRKEWENGKKARWREKINTLLSAFEIITKQITNWIEALRELHYSFRIKSQLNRNILWKTLYIDQILIQTNEIWAMVIFNMVL